MTSPAMNRAPGAPALPTAPFRFILYFVFQFPWRYAGITTLEAATATCGILIPYALSKIIKSVTSTDAPVADIVSHLHGPVLLFFALSLGEVIFGRLAGAIQIRLGPRQRQNVARQLYHYLQYHSHNYFNSNFAGALAHRINETAMGVTQTLWTLITEFWPTAIVISVSIFLLFGAHTQLGSFVAIWAALYIGISYFLARRCQPYALGAANARSETTGLVVDSVTNLVSARLFARLEFERDLLDETLQREYKAIRRSNGYAERVRWFQFSAAALLKAGILYFALKLWGSGQIGVGDFVMAVSLSLLIITEARNLSRRFLEFFEYIGNVGNGVATIVSHHELVDLADANTPRLHQGSIEFRDVTFQYGNHSPVFNRLNIRIDAGQRVGLVGFSGSGKSTFVSLILRLYDVQQGNILLDDIDIRTMTQDALHQQLSLIPQDPSLFHRSLRENIRYGKIEASDQAVEDAAKKAHAHDFIKQIPEGYDALVGERGVKLSGGQRQRVAIARVILKDAPILILDEATSSLDSKTEKAIQDTLEEVMRNKTVLVVAHRLSTIAHLDRILVFDQGQIIEDGTHTELLNKGGAYFGLWSRQSDGFLPTQQENGPETLPVTETQTRQTNGKLPDDFQ